MQPRFSVFRAALFSTALASVSTLGGSAPAKADLFAFGETGAVTTGETYAGSLGELDIKTKSGAKAAINTGGNQGWLSNAGLSHAAGANGSPNYLAGNCSSGAGCQKAQDHDNFFVFSLAQFNKNDRVSSATLHLNAGNVVGTGFYDIYDTSLKVANTLLAGVTSPDGTDYTSLTTTGALIGHISFTSSATGGVFNIALNDLGIRDLDYDIATGAGIFAIGGSVDAAQAAATDPFPPGPIPPSAASPLPGVGILQSLGVLGLLGFAAARARFRG